MPGLGGQADRGVDRAISGIATPLDHFEEHAAGKGAAVELEVFGLAVAVMAGASIVGRLAGGWALAYISSRYFVLALSVGQGAALILFAFAQGKVLLVVSALFGCTVGNLLMMQPLMLAEAFGLPVHAVGVGEQAGDLRPFAAIDYAKGLVGAA